MREGGGKGLSTRGHKVGVVVGVVTVVGDMEETLYCEYYEIHSCLQSIICCCNPYRSVCGKAVRPDPGCHGDGHAPGAAHSQAKETGGQVRPVAQDRPKELLQKYGVSR